MEARRKEGEKKQKTHAGRLLGKVKDRERKGLSGCKVRDSEKGRKWEKKSVSHSTGYVESHLISLTDASKIRMVFVFWLVDFLFPFPFNNVLPQLAWTTLGH